MRSGIQDDSMKSNGFQDNLEKYLIQSFVSCPSVSQLNIDLISNLHNCDDGNLHFDDVLIDDCQSDYIMYLRRYFVSLVVY